MDSDLFELMFRVYRNVRTDIDSEVDAIFDPDPGEGQPSENAAAKAALSALRDDVRAKRSDDGLRRAHAELIAL